MKRYTADCYGGLHLSPEHLALIRASAISPDVVRERGYRSVTKAVELERLGFGQNQRQAPALVVPVWGVDGQLTLHQARPDSPRADSDGKPIKYETPRRARMCLDIPPRVRQRGWLDDPGWPLWITEGARKVDAAVSIGLCCLGLLGVTCWRGRNEHGGLTALADWEHVPLNGREVFVAFDSDVMTKREVYRALVRLARFLASKDARVRYVYLPPGEGGRKIGLDDYLAAGHTIADLMTLVTDELHQPPDDDDGDYEATEAGLIWRKPTAHGPTPVLLTNFLARIVGDVAQDDGAEITRALEIEARLNGQTARFTLPAREFVAMNWPMERLGALARVSPGIGGKERARDAIQWLSRTVVQRTVYLHTGWKKIGDDWVYLHAGGAIGARGTVAGIEVNLPPTLARYELPDLPDGDELVAAIRASLAVLTVGPDRLTVPLLAAAYRAPLGSTDFGLHLAGPTGAGKSELAALAQQHYGAGMDRLHLPGNYASTGNSLEGLMFHAKDALLTVDDFCPTGDMTSQQRYHREADRIVRAQGNQAGRLRMAADGSLRPSKAPRGLLLSSGEDTPKGQSLRARLLVLEVGPDDVAPRQHSQRLTPRQQDASAGRYTQALAGYVRWLAPQYDQARERARQDTMHLRQQAAAVASHARTPNIVGELAAGWHCFLTFAVEAGAVTPAEAAELWQRGWAALVEAGRAQASQQAASEPTARFLELLGAALASKRAYIATRAGDQPDDAEAWGWRFMDQWSNEAGTSIRRWQAPGTRIGWIDGDDLYLEPSAAYSIANRLGQETADALAVTKDTLSKRLHQRGLLASVEPGNLTVRKQCEGRVYRVWHFAAACLSSHDNPSNPSITEAALSAPPFDGFSEVHLTDSDRPSVSHPVNGFSPAGGEIMDQLPDLTDFVEPDQATAHTGEDGAPPLTDRTDNPSTESVNSAAEPVNGPMTAGSGARERRRL